MPLELRKYQSQDLETLRALIRDPSLAGELDTLQGADGIERKLADPYHAAPLLTLAFLDGTPVGFAGAFILTSREGRLAVHRVGVIERFRRRGVGAALHQHVAKVLISFDPGIGKEAMGAWQPSPEADRFAARHGFAHARWFWLMERTVGPIAEPAWPDGVSTERWDGSEGRARDMSDAYNDSFSKHFGSPQTTPETTLQYLSRPGVLPDGLRFAYRSGRCVGFCRCELFEGRGEIAVLGTTHDARGIGLGRALLRWGVRWLEAAGAPRVTLVVDGENETALRLYRGEGFEVARTRHIWTRPGPAGPG
jgi:mycothiol synthase